MSAVTALAAQHHVSSGLKAMIFVAAASYRKTAAQPVEIDAITANYGACTQRDTWSVSSFGQVTIGTAEEWARFRLLSEKWRKERGVASSITDIVTCQPYQRIIGMGETAVPFILRQMQDEGNDPDHWFWALEMITGEDPVPVEAYGDTVRMAQAWFAWAEGRYAW